MFTEIWRSRLRSGSAHWNLELAVEGGVGAEGGGQGARHAALIKFSNPHLAGGAHGTRRVSQS